MTRWPRPEIKSGRRRKSRYSSDSWRRRSEDLFDDCGLKKQMGSERRREMPEKFGLIAGNGQFPFIVLQSAREQSVDVIVAAIQEETYPGIESFGFPVHWLGLGQLGK